MACAFETTGAICMDVTLLMDRTARNTAELSDITFKVAKVRIYQRLAKMERSLDCNEIGRRCLSRRPNEKYPRKQTSKK
jgi:hypothetical protein